MVMEKGTWPGELVHSSVVNPMIWSHIFRFFWAQSCYPRPYLKALEEPMNKEVRFAIQNRQDILQHKMVKVSVSKTTGKKSV